MEEIYVIALVNLLASIKRFRLTNDGVIHLDIAPNTKEVTISCEILFADDRYVYVGEEAWKQLQVHHENNFFLVPFAKWGKELENNQFWYYASWNYNVEEITSIILKKLIQQTNKQKQLKSPEIVVSVPQFFFDKKQSVKNAIKLAGLEEPIDIITEPLAAVIGYDFFDLLIESKVLVFSLHDDLPNITIFEVGNKAISVIETYQRQSLSTLALSTQIITYAKEIFFEGTRANFDVPFNSKYASALCKKTEDAIESLSSGNDNCQLEVKTEEHMKYIPLSQDQFKTMCEKLIRQCIVECNFLFEETNLTWNDIDKILLLGNHTQEKILKEILKKEWDKELEPLQDPKHIVPRGAALWAKKLKTGFIDLNIFESESKTLFHSSENHEDVKYIVHSLGVLAEHGSKNIVRILIEKHTSIPCNRMWVFKTKHKNRSVNIHIFEGESKNPIDNSYIGSISINNLRKHNEEHHIIKVEFTIDIKNQLEVVVTDIQTKQQEVKKDFYRREKPLEISSENLSKLYIK